MNKTQLPAGVFQNPLIHYANFQDGSFVNIIKLTKPYANGKQYAVYHTSTGEVIGGMYISLEKAEQEFVRAVRMNEQHSRLTTTSEWIVTPYFGSIPPKQEEVKPVVNERTLKFTEEEVDTILNCLEYGITKDIFAKKRTTIISLYIAIGEGKKDV